MVFNHVAIGSGSRAYVFDGGQLTLIVKLFLQMCQSGKVTELTFTCSKSTIETLEKGVKHVQS